MIRSIRIPTSLSVFSLALLFSACGSPLPKASIDTNDVIAIRAGNKKVEFATQQAVAKLPEFFKKANSPGPDETDFGVKFDLTPDRPGSEYIWAGKLTFRGDVLEGVLGDAPYDPRYWAGQRVTINKMLIIDWGYRKGGVMQGHYTTKALITELSPEEAKHLNKYYGWTKSNK
jgi:uncharacterized protein YegJ (DUF2314 family)